MTDKYHQTVMLEEVLNEIPGGKVIDCTLGTGGHTQGLVNKGCQVLAIEADPKMLKIARKRLGDKAKLILGNFVEIDKIAQNHNFLKVDAILFDLGVSNLHFKSDDRGFSFEDENQLLDMRLNPDTQGVKALDLLNALNIGQLIELFSVVLKPKDARELGRRVMENRPITTVGQFKKLCWGLGEKKKLSISTLPMLALRIAVNSELTNLEEVLPKAFSILKEKGKLLVITFHSKEREILDNFKLGNKRVLYPTENEIRLNPRSRSARLYIVEK